MVTGLEKRIGLFGGSFNPAHEGHLYISQVALKELGLDEVWWLVAPNNPQKKASSLAPFNERVEGAKKITLGNPIKVLELERENNLYFTIDTVRFLNNEFPDNSFVWLMGADCFRDLHTWKSWQDIMAEIPIAVFPRPGFTTEALSGNAATKFKKNRLNASEAQNLVVTKPAAWVYIDCKESPFSGTKIRESAKAKS
jgi:nicotinate-nucleotide adenylyltransferase